MKKRRSNSDSTKLTAPRARFRGRNQNWQVLGCIVFSLLLRSTPVIQAAAVEERCTVKSECQLCTNRDLESIPECKKTGKTQTLTCVTMENGVEVDTRRKIESCNRTRADEDYLMVQLQVICLLAGSFFYMTVKRQRQLYAHGFDLRKENLGDMSVSHYSAYSRGGSTVDRVSVAEERVPLTKNNNNNNGGNANNKENETGIEIV